MLPNFGEWLRRARPQLNNELVHTRAAAVDQVAASLADEQAVQLVHFVIRGNSALPDFLTAALAAGDATLPMRDNAAELRILAAAILATVMQSTSDAADVAALGVICGVAAELRSVGPVPELLEIAERYVFEQGRQLRAPNNPPAVTLADLRKPIDDVIAALSALNQGALNEIAEFIPILNSALVGLAQSTNTAIQSVAEDTASLREQLDIVWWTFGGHLSTGRSFAEVDLAELILPVGGELARLTAFVPGPVGARGYIRAALRTGRQKLKQVALASAVDAVSGQFTNEHGDRLLSFSTEFVCPLAAALNRRKSAGEAWKGGFSKQLSISVEKAVNPEALAYQMYTERLLLRALGGA